MTCRKCDQPRYRRRTICHAHSLEERRTRDRARSAEVTERRKTDPAYREALRANQRKYLYGITASEWDAMFERQGRACAICKSTTPGGKYDWATDHDHRCCPGKRSCGKCLRGILCPPCNKGIGMLGDDLGRLQDAVAYLLAHQDVLALT